MTQENLKRTGRPPVVPDLAQLETLAAKGLKPGAVARLHVPSMDPKTLAKLCENVPAVKAALETGWARKQAELLENLKKHSKANFIPAMFQLKSAHLGGFEDQPAQQNPSIVINVTESVLGQEPKLILDDDEPKKLTPPRHLMKDEDF